MASKTYTVAIIGAGVQGLGALKNLVEASDDKVAFTTTIFERRDTIGGLWAYTTDTNIPTVIPTTLGNVSRYKNCYTDFPVEDADFDPEERKLHEDFGVYLGQKGMMRYLERYVAAFGLRRHIKFRSEVVGIERNHDEGRGDLRLRTHGGEGGKEMVEEVQQFDKIMVASGAYAIPFTPQIGRLDHFKGTVVHSQGYKRGSDFAGKKVMVLGFGNTAADVATDLAKHADQVYLSHRNGNYILPRIVDGQPLDVSLNLRKRRAVESLEWIAPASASKMMATMIRKLSDSSFKLRPEWNFRPVPPLAVGYPIVSDTLVDHLAKGSITSTAGIRCVVSPHTVELNDGSQLEIDSLVICTGYLANTALMSEVAFEAAPTTSDKGTESRIPMLYKNLFAPSYPDSLVFTNNWKLTAGIAEIADLMAMAIAQVWKGAFRLPSRSEMEQDIKRHRDWCRLTTGVSNPPPKLVNQGEWRAWLHAAAGTGVNEKLGYGLQGWLFWFRERQLCSLLMTGIDTPFVSRLFGGRRKRWPGARQAIESANHDLESKFGGGAGKVNAQ